MFQELHVQYRGLGFYREAKLEGSRVVFEGEKMGSKVKSQGRLPRSKKLILLLLLNLDIECCINTILQVHPYIVHPYVKPFGF